jgi:hypothetical protein
MSIFSDFPLYNSLKKKVSNSSPSVKLEQEEKMEIINRIKGVKTPKEYEIIYALIKAYALDNNIQDNLPYNCSKTKTGYKFDLDYMPHELTHILLEFSRLKLD